MKEEEKGNGGGGAGGGGGGVAGGDAAGRALLQKHAGCGAAIHLIRNADEDTKARDQQRLIFCPGLCEGRGRERQAERGRQEGWRARAMKWMW